MKYILFVVHTSTSCCHIYFIAREYKFLYSFQKNVFENTCKSSRGE